MEVRISRLLPFPLAALLVALVCAPGVRADEDETPVRGPPLTALAAGPLGRSEVVCVGTVDVTGGLGRPTVARVVVERLLKGRHPSGTLTVLVRGPRPTNDPAAPSVPYLAPGDTGRYVLFLARGEGGTAYRLETLIAADPQLFDEKLRAIESQVQLAAEPDPERRARATLDWLLGSQEAEGTWTRVHGARELSYLVAVRPDLFDGGILTRLRGIARKSRTPGQRKWLAALLRRLAEDPPEPASSAPGEAVALPTLGVGDVAGRRRAWEAALRQGLPPAVLRSAFPGEPTEVRSWLLEAISAGGHAELLPAVLSLYAMEADGEIRARIVRAVGRLGTDADVPWLEARLGSVRLARESLVALARIRTPLALAVLDEARREALADPTPADDRVALIDYLRSAAFEEVEAAEGLRAPIERPR